MIVQRSLRTRASDAIPRKNMLVSVSIMLVSTVRLSYMCVCIGDTEECVAVLVLLYACFLSQSCDCWLQKFCEINNKMKPRNFMIDCQRTWLAKVPSPNILNCTSRNAAVLLDLDRRSDVLLQSERLDYQFCIHIKKFGPKTGIALITCLLVLDLKTAWMRV